MLACSQCGAGVPVDRSQTQIRCAFCGTDSPVDQAKLAWHQSLPRAAEAAETEGQAALRQALVKQFKPTCGGVMAMASALFLGGVVVVILLTAIAGGGVYIPFALFGIWIGGSIVAALIFRSIAQKAPGRADQEMAAVHAAVTREPSKGSCPECAANVVVPQLAASVMCLFCHSPLVAAEGMLVKWVEDAQQRRAAWAAQAQAIIQRVQRRSKRMEWLSYAIYVSPLMLLVAVIGAFWLLKGVGVISGARTLKRGATVLVKTESGAYNQEVVGIYGKLVKVKMGGGSPAWIAIDDLKYEYEAEAEPDDKSKQAVGDRVEAPWKGIGHWPGTVKEVYGKMIFVRFDDGITEWVDSKEAKSAGARQPSPKTDKSAKPSKSRKGNRRRRGR
jgi:hypothetical protein